MRLDRLFSALGLTAAAATLPLLGCDSTAEPAPAEQPDDPAPQTDLAKSNLERELAPDVPAADLEALVKGHTAFALDLYHAIRADHPGNLFYSPFSVSQALAMTWAGARGDTEAAIAEAMHFDLAQPAFHRANNALDLALAERAAPLDDPDAGDPFVLNVVNALWGAKDKPFEADFLDVLALNYGAGMHRLDFKGDPEGSRGAINDWVEAKTNDRIQDLLPEGSITPNTALVLTNAIFFKASWATPFEEFNTKDQAFTLAGGEEVAVPFMNAFEGFMHADTPEYSAVELPYAGHAVSMVVIAPKGDFAAFEAGLGVDQLDAIIAGLEPGSLELSFPKFTFDSDVPLSKVLKAMGMEIAFGSGADFSGIDGSQGLAITDVLHKAFVGVDEKGTEAAAATAVVVGETSVPVFEPLAIDRPFLFVIRDEPTGAVLFVGRVLDPR